MPLEPVDLASLDAYAEKCKKEVARVAKDEVPFWVYKDFQIPDKGRPVKTILLVLFNRGKVSSLLTKATLVVNGNCSLQEGKIAFTPEKGKVPYGLLKKQEGRFFGGKKILIPPGAEEGEGREGEETAVATAGAGPGSGVGTPPQTPPQAPPQLPGVSPARAKFVQDFEAAKPLLAQARAIVPDSVSGPLKAVLLQLPKTSAVMNDAAGKGNWAEAAEALKMLVEGATEVLQGKKRMEDGKGAFQKEFGVLKAEFEAAKAAPEGELAPDVKALQVDLAKDYNRMAAAANAMDWAAAQKVLLEAAPKLKKFATDRGAHTEAKKKYETDSAAVKAELDAAVKLKPGDLDQPLQQLQAKVIQAVNEIAAATTAGNWTAADALLAKLTPEVKKFTAAKIVHDTKVAFDKDFAKVKPQLEIALAIPAAELVAALKPAQPLVSNAGDAVTAAIGEANWSKAQAALNTLKTELKKLNDGKRDQDIARRKYAEGFAKLRARVEAVEQGPKTPPLDALRKACLDANTAMQAKAKDLEFVTADAALADVGSKADAYLKAAGDAEGARSKAVGDAKNAALAENEEAAAAAQALPADTTATDAVRNAAASTEALTKSKGLQEILAAATAIDQAWKKAVLSGAASRMGGVIGEIDACLEKIAKYQKEHKATGNKDDKTKFDASETLRENLEAIQKGLNGMAPAMKYVGSVENAGEEGAAKAAAVIVRLLKKATSAEAKTMLKQRYNEIAARLSKPGDSEDRQREVARTMGGDKEKEFFEARYTPLQANLQAADRIATVTKATGKAKATYDDIKSTVESSVARGDYAAATSDLPKLKQATAEFLALQTQATAEAGERGDRRVKAAQAYKKAASKAEMEEIAKSMGGEVQAAFERQDAAGPMTRQADASKDKAAKQTAAKLQDGAASRNCEVARNVADRLINDDGELEVVALYMNDPDELAKALGVSPNSKQLARALKKLRDEPQLAEKLASVGKPNPKNPACQMIRSSLGLAADAEVTEVHARKAALSAMLAELRQSDVGSCYATSTAIRVHDADPGRMLDDLKQLIETGKMTRDVQQGGATIHFEVPLSLPVSGSALTQTIKVGTNGNLQKVGAEDVTPAQHISGTPPVAAALTALGVAPNKHAETVNNAMAALHASKAQAGKAALAGALPATIQDPAFPADPNKKIPNKMREELLAKIPALLAGQPDQPKAKAALQAELAGLPAAQRNAVLAAFDNYFTAADHEFTPEDIVKQSAMTKAGISESDMAERERLEGMNLKLRGVRGQDPETYDAATKKLLEEYNTLATKVSAKRENFGKYDELAGAAKNGYLAQQDNRLLRAWEYSVTSMVEQGVYKRHSKLMKDATENQVKTAVESTVVTLGGPGGAPAKLTQAGVALQKKFGELWDQSVRLGYDASKQGAVSADGSSSKGGHCLFDKAGIDDPNQHIPVNDKNSYTKLIEGLMSKATAEVLGSERDPAVVDFVKKVGAAVAEKAAQNPESFVSGAVGDIQPKDKRYKEPWAVVAGGQMEPILTAYYGQDVSASVAKKVPANPEEMTGWLLDSGRQLMANIPDKSALTPETRIPMRGGPHVWSLRPGDPKVRKVLESPGDAAAFKNEEAAKYDAQKNTPLSPELKKAIVEDFVKGWADIAKADLLAAIPANAKAEEAVTKIEEYFTAHYPDFSEKAQTRATASVMKNVAPPVEQAGGKLAAHLDGILKKLTLGDKEAAVKSAVIASFNVAGTPPPATVSMTAIEKAVAKTLKTLNLRPDEAAAAAEVCRAQKPPATPPGLPFGDTNWGGGDHHTLFSMVRNPKTAALEMWQCNEDGSEPSKLNSDEWINGQQYEMATNPAMIGGLV